MNKRKWTWVFSKDLEYGFLIRTDPISGQVQKHGCYKTKALTAAACKQRNKKYKLSGEQNGKPRRSTACP